MTGTISFHLELRVRDGQLGALRELMPELVAAAREEPGTLAYEWFLSEDGRACHVYERYADSESMVAHLDGFGRSFADRFAACVEPTTFCVYGELSLEAREALSGFDAQLLAPAAGFARGGLAP